MKSSGPLLDKPLLRRSLLEPGESLPSLLTRLALLNYYSPPSILERLFPSEMSGSNSLECPNQAIVFERLAMLTGLPAFDLYLTSDHRFLSHYPYKLFALEQKQLPHWFAPPHPITIRPAKAAQFCQQCLCEKAYHWLAWRPAAMSLCLVHGCLLRKDCPHCHRTVTIHALAQARCQHCDGDLRKNPIPAKPVDEWAQVTQQTLWAWLLGETKPRAPDEWPMQPPDTLCQLAEGLALGVLYCPERFSFLALACPAPNKHMGKDDRLIQFTPSELNWAYAQSLKWMTHWPEGFREFLHYYVPDPQEPLEGGLGHFYRRWLARRWSGPHFQFVQQAYNQYRADRRWLMQKPDIPIWPYISLKEAADQMNTNQEGLFRLAHLGQIQMLQVNGVYWPERFLLRAEVRRLQQQWHQPLVLDEAAHWLGISHSFLKKLSRVRLIRGRRFLDDSQETGPVFAKSTIIRLLQRVNDAVWIAPSQAPDRWLTLTEVAERLAGIGWDEGKLLRDVVERTLPAYREPANKDALDIATLRFMAEDVDRRVEAVMRENEWVTCSRAAQMFWVEEADVLHWIDLGLLKPVAHYLQSPLLTYRALEMLDAELLSFDDVRQALNMSKRMLLRRIELGKIQPITKPTATGDSRYLFLRRQIERVASRRKHSKC